MSEIKNESFSIGDRFRGLVNGEILVVEALPKKAMRSALRAAEDGSRRATASSSSAKRTAGGPRLVWKWPNGCSWKGSGERYEIRETQETAGNEAQRGEVL